MNAVDVRLGQRVRVRRLQIGMSQEQLAALLGVTFQQVQKYEKGVNRIAASRLFDICAALETSIEKMYDGIAIPLGGHDRSRELGLVDNVLATPEGIQLVTLFSGVKSAKVRQRIIDLVRAMCEAPS